MVSCRLHLTVLVLFFMSKKQISAKGGSVSPKANGKKLMAPNGGEVIIYKGADKNELKLQRVKNHVSS